MPAPAAFALTPLVRVVDDNASLRESLAFMLSCEGYDVVDFESAERFLREDMHSRPGCLVLDLQMDGMNGLELQRELLRRRSTLPIIFLTAHGTIGAAVESMRTGAFDFQEKPVDPAKFLPVVARAVKTSIERSGEVGGGAGAASLGIVTGTEAVRRLSKLTPREEEVLRAVAGGLTNREAAQRLGISVRTVETIRAAAFRKLETKSLAAVASLFEAVEEVERGE